MRVHVSVSSDGMLSVQDTVKYIEHNMPAVWSKFYTKVSVDVVLGDPYVAVVAAKTEPGKDLSLVDMMNKGVRFALFGFDSDGNPNDKSYLFDQQGAPPPSWKVQKMRKVAKRTTKEAADHLIKYLTSLLTTTTKQVKPTKGIQTAILSVIRGRKLPLDVLSVSTEIELELGKEVKLSQIYNTVIALAKKNLVTVDKVEKNVVTGILI